MNSCQVTSLVTAIANALANCVPKDEIPVLAVLLTQLGDTLATIEVVNSFCENK